MSKAKIYLIGATGKLGRTALDKINSKLIIPLVRKKSGLSNEQITDFSEEDLGKKLRDADVILHLAGSVDTLDRKKLWEANFELTKRIVSAAPKKARIVFTSSIAVYGKKLAEIPANEKTKLNPDSEYAKSKYEAEKLVESHENHVIIRIGTLYGSEFSDYYKVLEMLEHGKMKIIGDGTNHIPFTSINDIVPLLERAISKGSGLYVAAGTSIQKEVFEIAAQELGVPPPTKHLSLGFALFFAWIMEQKYRFGGKRPSLTKEHIGVIGYNRVFDCSKAEKEFDFKPRSIKDGIAQIVQEYRNTFKK